MGSPRIKAVHGELNVTAEVWKEDPMYVAQCQELKVVSQGNTPSEALANLEEAVELYLEDQELDNVIIPLKFNFDFENKEALR